MFLASLSCCFQLILAAVSLETYERALEAKALDLKPRRQGMETPYGFGDSG